jgi:hypothetical protein
MINIKSLKLGIQKAMFKHYYSKYLTRYSNNRKTKSIFVSLYGFNAQKYTLVTLSTNKIIHIYF